MNNPVDNPSSSEPDIWVLAKKIRYDLTAAQAKLSDLMRELGKLPIPDPSMQTCPHCGPVPASVRMADHLANVHGK